jgi:hypothetical protein
MRIFNYEWCWDCLRFHKILTKEESITARFTPIMLTDNDTITVTWTFTYPVDDESFK